MRVKNVDRMLFRATNLEAVIIEFRHLPFLLLSSSDSLAP